MKTELTGVETEQNHTYAVSCTKAQLSHTHTHTRQTHEKESKRSSAARGWREKRERKGLSDVMSEMSESRLHQQTDVQPSIYRL